MLDAIKSFVNRHIAPATDVAPSTPADDHEPPVAPDGVKIAACALLLEVAHADREFSPTEQAHIEEALGRHFDLDDATLKELLDLADAERRQSIDHFQFTRLINEHYDLGQKMVLAELMWGVVLADGEVAKHESYLVRKLANLLDLEPAYLAQARRRAAPES
jgi:uncharacterized tellurite resistance protein B-like protein